MRRVAAPAPRDDWPLGVECAWPAVRAPVLPAAARPRLRCAALAAVLRLWEGRPADARTRAAALPGRGDPA